VHSVLANKNYLKGFSPFFLTWWTGNFSLQNASGLRPDEKLANMMACGGLQNMQYAAGRGLVNSLQIVAGLLTVKSLQMSAGLLPAYDFSCFFLTWWTGNFSTFSTAVGSLNVINPKPLDLLVAGSFMTSARSPKVNFFKYLFLNPSNGNVVSPYPR
jgi:hypothetical protein